MAYRGDNIDVRAVRQAEAMMRKAKGKNEIIATGLSILYPKCQKLGTKTQIWITDEEPASKELWRYRFAVSSSGGQNFSKYRRREEKSRSVLLIMYENGQTEIRGETHLVNPSKDFENIRQFLTGNFSISGEKPATGKYFGLGEGLLQTHTLEIEYEDLNGIISKEQRNLCLPYTHWGEQESVQQQSSKSASDNAMVMEGWMNIASSTGKEGRTKGQRSNLWAEMNPLGDKGNPKYMADQMVNTKRENEELKAEIKVAKQNEYALREELASMKQVMDEWAAKCDMQFNELRTTIARHEMRLNEVVALRSRCRDVEEPIQSRGMNMLGKDESQEEGEEEGEPSHTQFTNPSDPFPRIHNRNLNCESMNMGNTSIDDGDL